MRSSSIKNTFAKPKKKPLLPEGIYLARVASASYCFAFSHKLVMQLEITHGGNTERFPHFCNVEIESNQLKPPGRASKLTKIWRRLRPDVPLCEISLEALAGVQCKVKIKTSKLDSEKRLMPSSDWYSVVEEILEAVEQPQDSFDDDIPF